MTDPTRKSEPQASERRTAVGASDRTGFLSTLLRGLWSVSLHLVLPGIALWFGIQKAQQFLDDPPEARRSSKERRPHLVEVLEVRSGTSPCVVHGMGTVIPAQEVSLEPEVVGTVTSLHADFVPGGTLPYKTEILTIDRRDYDLAVQQRTADLARAEADLAMELGNQAVAQREFELLGASIEKGDRDLVLRKPQLATVQSRVDAAKAALSVAKLAVERTTVLSPFNAMIRSRNVAIGARASPGVTVATLVCTDEFWIEVVVPVSELKWIRFPTTGTLKGAKVKIRDPAAWGEGKFRWGEVRRLAGDLEDTGRLARVIVSLGDPLVLDGDPAEEPRLLLGSFVRVEITGPPLFGVIPVPRSLVRAGDQVWVMSPNDRLEIRKVLLHFRAEDTVFVSKGLVDGELVITSDLAGPVEGMPLRRRLVPVSPGSAPAGGGR